LKICCLDLKLQELSHCSHAVATDEDITGGSHCEDKRLFQINKCHRPVRIIPHFKPICCSLSLSRIKIYFHPSMFFFVLFLFLNADCRIVLRSSVFTVSRMKGLFETIMVEKLTIYFSSVGSHKKLLAPYPTNCCRSGVRCFFTPRIRDSIYRQCVQQSFHHAMVFYVMQIAE
jgi:hypothetical protein